MKSMTGYALTKGIAPFGDIEVEIKSVNSKNLDINCRLPKVLNAYEMIIRDWIHNNIQRGKISCTVNITKFNPTFSGEKTNPDVAKHYCNLLNDLKKSADIIDEITIDHLLHFPDIFYTEEPKEVNDQVVGTIAPIFEECLQKLNSSRQKEGDKLNKDLKKRIQKLNELIIEIEPLALTNPQVALEKQQNRLKERFANVEIDEQRLAQELVIWADKVDVTEEVIRFKSHLHLLEETLELEIPVGKKLNFILQELHRELNTMTVKTTILDISHKVVVMKEEVEKIREQIQNIE